MDNALTLVLGVAMAWYFVLASRGIPLLIALLYLPLGSAAVLLTGSRAGFLALLVASVFPLLMMSHAPTRTRALTISIFLAAVMGLGVAQFIPEASWARLATTWNEISKAGWCWLSRPLTVRPWFSRRPTASVRAPQRCAIAFQASARLLPRSRRRTQGRIERGGPIEPEIGRSTSSSTLRRLRSASHGRKADDRHREPLEQLDLWACVTAS